MSTKPLSPKDIGALVRQTRVDAGLTQEELAKKIGASRFWVAAFERGKPRAELGLALKALRALELTVTVDRAENKSVRAREPHAATRHGQINLDAILNASAALYGNTVPYALRESSTRALLKQHEEDLAKSHQHAAADRPTRKKR